MRALLSFLLLFIGKKLRREDIRWEASDKGGGAQREDIKKAEAMGATQNLFTGKWDKTTFRNKGDWIERLRRGGEEQRVKLQPRNSL